MAVRAAIAFRPNKHQYLLQAPGGGGEDAFDKGGTALQVNYVQMNDAVGAKQAAAMLKDVPGTTNSIGVKNNIAVEIIGSPANKELVVKKLDLSD